MNKTKESINKIWNSLNFSRIFGASIMMSLIVSMIINVICFTSPPQIIEKEVIVKNEVIKYVEKKGGTPTEKFIIYLNSRIDPVTAKIIANAIDKSSKKYSLPRKIILSIINKESFFNTLAKSHKDCVGLMQVNPKAHKEKVKDIPPTHLYHININVDIGCKIFKEYFDKNKGDLHKTFHSYLGKRASKQEIAKYKNEILYTFAELEMYEYIGQKKEKNDKKIVVNVNSNNSSNGMLPESN